MAASAVGMKAKSPAVEHDAVYSPPAGETQDLRVCPSI